MKTLYIDTHSTKFFSLGYFDTVFKMVCGIDASSQMIQKIDEISNNDIDEIIINTGPGSLTGLRIGSSFAQGIALGFSLSKNIKVLGLSIWDILLLEYPEVDIFFFTGTKKWIKKNNKEEIIFEKNFNLSSEKWISNNPDLVPLDKNKQIKFNVCVELMHKYKEKASDNINLLYPINMF